MSASSQPFLSPLHDTLNMRLRRRLAKPKALLICGESVGGDARTRGRPQPELDASAQPQPQATALQLQAPEADCSSAQALRPAQRRRESRDLVFANNASAYAGVLSASHVPWISELEPALLPLLRQRDIVLPFPYIPAHYDALDPWPMLQATPIVSPRVTEASAPARAVATAEGKTPRVDEAEMGLLQPVAAGTAAAGTAADQSKREASAADRRLHGEAGALAVHRSGRDSAGGRRGPGAPPAGPTGGRRASTSLEDARGVGAGSDEDDALLDAAPVLAPGGQLEAEPWDGSRETTPLKVSRDGKLSRDASFLGIKEPMGFNEPKEPMGGAPAAGGKRSGKQARVKVQGDRQSDFYGQSFDEEQFEEQDDAHLDGGRRVDGEMDEEVRRAMEIIRELEDAVSQAAKEEEQGRWVKAVTRLSAAVRLGARPFPRPVLRPVFLLGDKAVTSVGKAPSVPKARASPADADAESAAESAEVDARETARRYSAAAVLFRRGLALRKLSLWEAAMSDFTECLALLPESLAAGRQLVRKVRWEHAQLLAGMHKLDAALESLSLLLGPPHGAAPPELRAEGLGAAEALELRARCLIGLSRDAEALAVLADTARSHPSRHQPRLMAGEVYERGPDSASALRELKAASLLNARDRDLCARILTKQMAQVDQTTASLSSLEYLDALIAKDCSTFALLERARLRATLGNVSPPSTAASFYSGASADLARVLTMCNDWDKDAALAYLYRGSLEAKVKPKRALADLKMARRLLPEDHRPCLAAGAIHEALGDAKRALEQYREAHRRDPADPFTLLAIAVVHTHFRPADLSTALTYATNAIQLKPSYVRAYAVRADVHRRRKDHALALRDVCVALHLAPGDPTLLALKAEHLIRLGRTQDAAAACAALAHRGNPAARAAGTRTSGEDDPFRALVGNSNARMGRASMARDLLGAGSGLSLGQRRGEHEVVEQPGGAPKVEPAQPPRHFAWAPHALRRDEQYRLRVIQAEASLAHGAAGCAVQLLEKALQAGGDNRPPLSRALDLSLLGVARQLAGDLVGARTAMDEAHQVAGRLGAQPRSDVALRSEGASLLWLRDGHLRLETGDAQGALKAYKSAAQAHRDSSQAHAAVGWAKHLLRLEREARLAGPSDETEPRGLEGLDADTLTEAVRQAEATEQTTDSALSVRRRARELREELSAFSRSVKLKKGLLRARLHRAYTLNSDGQHFRAAAELERITGDMAAAPEQSSSLANVLIFRCVVQSQAGQFAASMLSLQDAMSRGQAGSSALRIAHFAQGTTMMRLGKPDTAVASLQRAALGSAACFASDATEVPAGGAASWPRVSKGVSPVAKGLSRRRDALLAFATAYNLGLALEQSGDAVSATEQLLTAQNLAAATLGWGEPAVVSSECRANCHIAAGMALLQQARSSEAQAQFSAALSLVLKGRCALQALLGLGHAHYDSGDYVGARRAYGRAAFTYPREPAPRLALARLLHHVDEAPSAMRCVAAVLELAPGHPDALEARAALRLSGRDTAGAIADLEASSASTDSGASGGHVDQSVSLAFLRLQLGSLARAGKELDGLCSRAATDAPHHGSERTCCMSYARRLVAMASHAAKRGQWEASARLCDEALAALDASAPRSGGWGTRSADSETGRCLEACAERDRATCSETSGLRDAAATATAAAVASSISAQGQLEGEVRLEARPSLFRPSAAAEHIAPGRVRVLRGRASFGAGLAYAFLGDHERAIERYDEAVRLRPECGFTRFNRAVLHLAAERWELAERDLKGCTQRLPLLPEGWLHKCNAILAQGDRERKGHALSDYANALVILDFDPTKAQL